MRLDFLRYPEHLGPHLVEASPYLYNRIYKGEAPTRQRYKVRKVSLYDELVTSLCIEVAYGVHRMAKTGAIKLSEIMIPRDGRNDLSSLLATSVTNKEENMNGLQSVDNPPPNKRQRCTYSISEKIEQESQQKPLETAKSRVSPTPMVTRNASNNPLDNWGRIIPKEPKMTVKCHHCGKAFNALRFATHLDKCLMRNTKATK